MKTVVLLSADGKPYCTLDLTHERRMALGSSGTIHLDGRDFNYHTFASNENKIVFCESQVFEPETSEVVYPE